MSEKLYTRMTRTHYYEAADPQDLGVADFYGTGTLRRVLHFTNCDLYKHQANFPGTNAIGTVVKL